MKTSRQAAKARAREEGYVLAAVLFTVAILVMSLAVALPRVREEIRRDQEIETMHRGQQYIRAIQLYYRKFRAYPPSVDALVGTNGLRFLRQRYTDPMTGKDDWSPILLGQNKAPAAMGFFGQPLDGIGATPAGLGSSGGNGANNSSASDSSLFDPQTNSPVDASANGADSGNGSGADSGTGATGQIFGGGGIMGFSPAGSSQSILTYKTKNHYNEWEFVYDPRADLMMRGMFPALPPAGPPTNTGSPGFNPTSAGANATGGDSPSPGSAE